MAGNEVRVDVSIFQEKMEQTVETLLARLNAARSALVQPDDLKAVYDKTFDKLVAMPTKAFERSEKALDEGIDASIKLAALAR